MKIDNSVPPIPTGRGNASSRVADAAAAKQGAVQAPARSPAASNVVQIGEAVAAKLTETSATFNSERVAEIKQAIAEGRFKVNAEKIADGLLSSVREMLQKNSRDNQAA